MKLIKEIIKDEEILGQVSSEINAVKENELVRTIVKSLKDTMEENNWLYLTAPQIGYTYRIFCIKFDTEIKTFVNPIIIQRDNNYGLSREKCNSLPDREFLVPRSPKITAIWSKPNGAVADSREFPGLAAYLFQHCIEHLDGVLCSDIGLEIDELYDQAPEEERIELVNDYLSSLDIKTKALKEEINNDEMLKKTSDAIEFLDQVRTGKVKLEHCKELEPVKEE